MWSYQARRDSFALLLVSVPCQHDIVVLGSGTRTRIVAWCDFTTLILPSLPMSESQIWSHHDGASSSWTTMNRGLSHLVMGLGSSYLKMRFSKSSSSYPPSLSVSASRALLISRHLSAGVPMCTSKTVSLALAHAATRRCTDHATGRLHSLCLAVQLVAKALDVVQTICNHDVVA